MKMQMRARLILFSKNQLSKLLLIVKLILLVLLEASAQNEIITRDQYRFRSISIDDGLSYERIISIAQDAYGFMWFGTSFGLNMYDGYSITTYEEVLSDSTSLFGERVNDILSDSKKNLWVATSKTVSKFNFDTKTFKHYKAIPKTQMIKEDSQGILWMTTEKGLAKFDPDTEEVFFYQHEDSDTQTLLDNNQRALLIDRNDNIWSSTNVVSSDEMGLTFFNRKTCKFKRFQHEEDNPQSLCENRINIIYEDSNGKIWIGTHNNGISIFNARDSTFRNFYPDSSQLSSGRVRVFLETKDGNFWVGTNAGLYLVDTVKMEFKRYAHEKHPFSQLNNNSIQCGFVDKHNGLWIGTFSGGINYSSLFRNGFVKYSSQLATNKYFLNDNSVNAIQTDNRGNVWVGNNRGLNYVDRTSGEITKIEEIFMYSNDINDIDIDEDNNVWTANNNKGGVNLLDTRTQKLKNFLPDPDNINSPRNNIHQIQLDTDGNAWVATDISLEVKKKGLDSFEQINSSNRSYIDAPDFSRINAIIKGRNGSLWFGGYDILSNYTPSTKKFEEFDVKQNKYWQQVTSITEDEKGQIWIVWDYHILLKLNPFTKKLENYGLKKGFPKIHIFSMLDDSNGNLWIGSNKGLVQLIDIINKPNELNYKVFTEQQGVQGKQFINMSSYKDKTGELFFGGRNGFNSFYPENVSLNPYVPETILNRFIINNKNVKIGEIVNGDVLLTESLLKSDLLKLNYQAKTVSIEFIGLHYAHPQENKYQYYLEGFDEEWIDLGTNRIATYTSLPKGEYTFKVKSSNNDGVWSKEERKLRIKVLAPWWEQLWARIILGIIVVGLGYTFYEYRLKNIKSKNRLLEKLVRQRTASLEEVNHLIQEQKEEIQAQAEELEESYKEISKINESLEEQVDKRTNDLKKSNQEIDNFVYRVSHDVRAPLSSIMGLIGLMEIESSISVLQEYLQMAKKSIYKLDGFVRDILDYSRNSRTLVKSEVIDFKQLIEQIIIDLQYMKNASNLEISVDVVAEEAFYSDTLRLQIVLRNLISNAIKYQNMKVAQSYLKIHVLVKDQDAKIILVDNGIGILESYQEKVFEMFFRGSESSVGSGIGLYIVKESIEKLGGLIKLQSIYGQGTTIEISLPKMKEE